MIGPSRILVTGAGGFLGAAIVRELAETGVHVRALVRTERAAESCLAIQRGGAPVDVVVGSLGGGCAEAEMVAGCDAVVHAAGGLRGAASTLVRQNVMATRRLVGIACRQTLRRFVLVSSLAVYDTARLRAGALLDERCPLDGRPEARSAYAYSKIVQEQICWQAHRSERLPLVVVRPGVIFGPGRGCATERAGPRIGRWVALVGPSRPLPYTFVRNCARAVALAATADADLSGEAFNIVDDELPTGREIVRRGGRAGVVLHSVPVPAACAPLLARVFAAVHGWADGMLPAAFTPPVVEAMYKPLRFSNARAKDRLAWAPAVDLDTAFALTFGAER